MEIIRRESEYKSNCHDLRSSAYGLAGFLRATWKGTGVQKTAREDLQLLAALRYIIRRYGTPEKALRFHKIHGYY